MIGIYRVVNRINGKSYIGQSINIQRRFWDHRCVSHESNVHLRHALSKYGKENFSYEVLEECSMEKLDEREIYYIKKYSPEYNVSFGGQGRKKRLPDDVRARLSLMGKRQWAAKTPEEREQIIKNNLLRGGKIGHPVSQETRNKLREKNLGKKQSRETIEKRKQTMLRLKANGYVKTNNHAKKKVTCVETGVTYESVTIAAKTLGIDASGITHTLRGQQKTTHGYHFVYFEGVETNHDECSDVGRKMGCRSKCKACQEDMKR